MAATNLVTISSGKSLEKNILMKCVVTVLVILQIATKDIQKFNLCMFLHTVSEQDDKFKELGDKVNKIEDNLNNQSNMEQKSRKLMRNQEILKGWIIKL